MFLVYELQDPDTRSCFYVGKGNTSRTRLADHIRNARHLIEGKPLSDRNRLKAGVIRKLLETGKVPLQVTVFESESEEEALAFEVKLISFYGKRIDGKGPLCNLTDGGEGTVGFKMSPESRNKISIAATGRRHSDASRKLMSEIARDKRHSADTRKKIGDKSRGRLVSDETREKLRDAARNRKNTNKGKPWSEARRKAQNERGNK